MCQASLSCFADNVKYIACKFNEKQLMRDFLVHVLIVIVVLFLL